MNFNFEEHGLYLILAAATLGILGIFAMVRNSNAPLPNPNGSSDLPKAKLDASVYTGWQFSQSNILAVIARICQVKAAEVFFILVEDQALPWERLDAMRFFHPQRFYHEGGFWVHFGDAILNSIVTIGVVEAAMVCWAMMIVAPLRMRLVWETLFWAMFMGFGLWVSPEPVVPAVILGIAWALSLSRDGGRPGFHTAWSVLFVVCLAWIPFGFMFGGWNWTNWL